MDLHRMLISRWHVKDVFICVVCSMFSRSWRWWVISTRWGSCHRCTNLGSCRNRGAKLGVLRVYTHERWVQLMMIRKALDRKLGYKPSRKISDLSLRIVMCNCKFTNENMQALLVIRVGELDWVLLIPQCEKKYCMNTIHTDVPLLLNLQPFDTVPQ